MTGCVLAAALLLAPGCTRAPKASAPPSDAGATEGPTEPPLPPELAAAVQALHADVEAERARVGTPGLALLVVKDGRVIHRAGYGVRDAMSRTQVDEDTTFAIGSTTKAFTAALALMAVDDGELSLEDHPKTCLPGYTLADPAADEGITLRDLLSHRSGLASMDLAWYAGTLSRGELLELLGLAAPVAPMRTQVHYQNLQFVAAGECVAQTLGVSYEELLRRRIFTPLGMQGASATHAEGLASENRAHGHARVGDDDTVVEVPLKNIDAVAPAGSINASVRALTPWLQMLLAGGEYEGGRLLSSEAFDEWLRPQAIMGPGVEYGLGWVLDRWRGERRVWHNGGIDGYYALISMLPEHDIGLVMLTSDDSAKLEPFITDRVFELAVAPSSEAPPPVDAAAIAGTYGIVGGFQAVIDRQGDPPAAHLTVVGQPPYPLQPHEPGRFRLGPPAPAGFFARVEGEGASRMLTIEQPQGPLSLPWLDPQLLAEAEHASVPKSQAPLLGIYVAPEGGVVVSVVASQGRVALSVAGTAPAPLVPRGKSETGLARYGLDGLPNAFAVDVRTKKKRVTGLHLLQPQGAIEVVRVEGTEPVTLSVDQFLAKVAKAHASAALARHETMEVQSALVFENEGVEGTALTRHRAPGSFAETLRLQALGKDLGTLWVGHHAGRGWERSTLSPIEDLGSVSAEALALQAPFDPWAAPKEGFARVEIHGVDLLPAADAPSIVLERETASGIVVTDWVSRTDFRLQQRRTVTPGRGGGSPPIELRRFLDYRDVDGVPIPHRIESTTANGRVVSTVESVRFDVALPDDAFAAPPPGG